MGVEGHSTHPLYEDDFKLGHPQLTDGAHRRPHRRRRGRLLFLRLALRSAERDAPFVAGVLKPMLMGEDPLARERIWQTMIRRLRGTQLAAVGAIDVALWDLAGRAAGVPVHRLMGSYRTSVPAYASSAVLDGPEAYAEEAVRLKEAGWPAYKIHPPGEPEEDIRICEAVRGAVGDDYRPCWTPPGPTTTQPRFGSGRPRSRWASIGTRIRLPMTICTAT